jgi:hypothetical protein
MLRVRTETEIGDMGGVNLAANPIKIAPGKFILLQNWIPGKKHKIKRKRGVTTLTSTAPGISSPTACGVSTAGISFECGHSCPLGQFVSVSVSAVAPTHPSGPMIRMDASSTIDAVFGLAAIYDPITNKVGLVWWNGEDLTDLATVLDVATSITLVEGDVLKVIADETTLYDYHVLVNDVSIIDYTDSGHTIPTDGDCVGFVTLENATWP